MGQCVAGGAYLPALSDVIVMVKGTSFMGLGGPNSGEGGDGPVGGRRVVRWRRHAHRGERSGPLRGGR